MDDVAMRGHVEAFLVAPNGERIPVQPGANTVSYACAEAVARLFAGRGGGPRKIVFAYAETDNKTFNFASNERDQDKATILGSLSSVGVDIDANSGVSSSDPATYKTGGNVVTLRATLSSNSSFYVYGYILEDAEGHVLATRKLDTPVQKPEEYAFAVSWAITFV